MLKTIVASYTKFVGAVGRTKHTRSTKLLGRSATSHANRENFRAFKIKLFTFRPANKIYFLSLEFNIFHYGMFYVALLLNSVGALFLIKHPVCAPVFVKFQNFALRLYLWNLYFCFCF